MSVAVIILNLAEFYSWLIIAHILLTWIPAGGFVDDLRRVLSTLVDPYLNIFRRVIPPIGMIDISPIVALFVLRMLANLIARVLANTL